MRRRPDPVVLAACIAAIAVGVLLALDRDGTLALSAGWVGALACAATGAVLVVSGITDRKD